VRQSGEGKKALHKAWSRTQSDLDVAGVIFLVLDAHGAVQMINRTGCDVLGYASSEIAGRNWFRDFLPDTIRDATKSIFDKLLAGDVTGIEPHENPIQTKAGEIRTIRWCNTPLMDEKGNITGVLSSGEDISRHKRVEKEPQLGQEELRNFFEHASIGMAIGSADGTLQKANTALCEMLGYSEDELIGRTFEHVVHPAECEADRDGLLHIVASQPESVPKEMEYIRKDGHVMWGLLNLFAVRDARGRARHFIAQIQDITERKRSEQAQEALHHIATAVLTSDSLAELFVEIRRELGSILETENFYIALYDESTDMISLPHITDQKDRFRKFPAGKSLTANVIRTGVSLLVQEDQIIKMAEAGEIQRVGAPAKIWLGVPLKVDDRVIGSLALQSYDDPSAYDEKDLAVLEFVSNQVALCVERKRAEEEVRNRATRLAVVTKTAKAVSAILQLEELMETVYRTTAPIFRADTFFIGFYDEETEEMDCRYLVDEGIKQPPTRIPLVGTLSSVVANERRVLHVHDWEKEKDQLPGIRLIGKMRPARSWLGVPLIVGERLIGILNVQAYRPNAYSEDEEKLLATIGDQIAVAFENARLYEGIKQELIERERSEGEVRKLNQYLKSVIDNADVWMEVVDRHNRITLWNKAAEEISGYAREEVVGHDKVWDWIYPREANRSEALASLVGAGGQGAIDDETTIRCKDGSTKIMAWNERCFLDDDGHPGGIIAIGRDITARTEAEARLRDTLRGAIEALALTTEMRDPYTAGHQERVADLSIAIAREMGLSDDQCEGIRVAGLMHDIGKMAVPAEILNKPRTLTDTEFNLVQGHPKAAQSILDRIDLPWPVVQTVLQHHERIDGSGYPDGLKGEEILLEARILAIADVVEAMSSHRPYRPAYEIEQALEEIREGAGIRYDERAVATCIDLFESGMFTFVE